MIDCGMYRRSRANDLAPAVDKNGLLTSNAALSMSDTFSFLFSAAISPETRYWLLNFRQHGITETPVLKL